MRTMVGWLLLVSFCLVGISAVGEGDWEDIGFGISGKEYLSIAEKGAGADSVYVGTSDGLYVTDEDGEWSRVFTCRGKDKGINHIFADNSGEVYIATNNGLYKSIDAGKTWERVFKGKGAEDKATYVVRRKAGGPLYLGTHRGLFRSKDGTAWQKSSGVLAGSKIISIALTSRMVFVVTDNGLYSVTKDIKSYRKILGTYISDIPNDEIDPDQESVEGGVGTFSMTDLTVQNKTLYLSTNRGLFVSEDLGDSWERHAGSGLPSRRVRSSYVSQDESIILVLTDDGVFAYDKPENKWMPATRCQDARKIVSTSFGNNLFALCKTRLYRTSLKVFELSMSDEAPESALLGRFGYEPTINEVQKMAIEYAEVYPEKIAQWRKDAKFKAILPKVNFGLDRSSSDTYEIYTASTKSYSVLGPRDSTDGWDLNFTWDLSDLVWNASQTAIDVRSKLMVQLRGDIVDEVTRAYFERRRLQVDNLTNPPGSLHNKLKTELRVRELTANIDGLTGSRFSQAITESRLTEER